jgi:hypothetical protein
VPSPWDWGQRMSWTWNWSVFEPALIVCTIFLLIVGAATHTTSIRGYGREADYAADPWSVIVGSIIWGAMYAAAFTAIIGLFPGNLIGIGVGVIVLALVVYWFWGQRMMACWNADPRQQQLIQLLIAAGMPTPPSDNTARIQVTNFLCRQADWSFIEDRKRLAHALTVVQRVSEPAVYEKARDVALSLSRASRGHA